MHSLKWSVSHAVFVPEVDDEHKEIFAAVARLQEALASQSPWSEIRELTRLLAASASGHFAHEERLMHAARYESLRWHKQQHGSARKRIRQFVHGVKQGNPEAGTALVEYLTSWLPNHARLPDRMMGAFLRNQRRSMFRLTFQAGTKPANACNWVDSDGHRFDPPNNQGSI